MERLNKKGFTLVELLAVIVILALIMVLTVPTILDQMNSARQSSFLLYAEEMLKTAQTKYQSDLLVGESPASCYDFATLTGSSNVQQQYKGKVIVADTNAATLTFKIVMYDNNYMVGYEEVTGEDGTKQTLPVGKTFAEIETMKSNLKNTKLTTVDTTKATADSVKCA